MAAITATFRTPLAIRAPGGNEPLAQFGRVLEREPGGSIGEHGHGSGIGPVWRTTVEFLFRLALRLDLAIAANVEAVRRCAELAVQLAIVWNAAAGPYPV